MSENTSDPAAIERDLERTRSRLDRRLDELQSRLSPGQVIDEAMAYFRTSQGADFARNLSESVRANPLPAALVGIGVAWLMASGRPAERREYDEAGAPAAPVGGVRIVSGHRSYDDLYAGVERAEASVLRRDDESESAWRDRVEAARGQALGLTRQAQETAQAFGQRIADALAAAKEGVSQRAQDLRDKAGAAGEAASDWAAQARDAASDWAERGRRAVGGDGVGGGMLAGLAENPVVLGAFGLAAGALLGALIPQSSAEQRALADTAGEARETLRGAAREAMERGTRAAQAAVDAGREAAQQEGLTGERSLGDLAESARTGGLADSGKRVVQAALRGADEAVRGESGKGA